MMQLTKHFGMKTFRPAAFLELPKKLSELFVRLLVLRMGRTPVFFHTPLLKLEMGFGIGLEKINQVKQEFGFLHRRVGIRQHAFQVIGIVDQHAVLLINRVGTDHKFFIPDYHDTMRVGLPSEPVQGHQSVEPASVPLQKMSCMI